MEQPKSVRPRDNKMKENSSRELLTNGHSTRDEDMMEIANSSDPAIGVMKDQ